MSGGLNNLVFNKDKSIAYATTEGGMVYGFNLKQQSIITKFLAHYDAIILSMHYLGKTNQLITVTSTDRIKV